MKKINKVISENLHVFILVFVLNLLASTLVSIDWFVDGHYGITSFFESFITVNLLVFSWITPISIIFTYSCVDK